MFEPIGQFRIEFSESLNAARPGGELIKPSESKLALAFIPMNERFEQPVQHDRSGNLLGGQLIRCKEEFFKPLGKQCVACIDRVRSICEARRPMFTPFLCLLRLEDVLRY